MEYRVLGRTDLQVSRVGLGTGGKSVLGQRKGYTEVESHRVVHKALDLGINLFDTSPAYLESEAILGRALKAAQARAKVHICTKVKHEQPGRSPAEKPTPSTPEEIIESVERSLKRLGGEALEIVLFHGVSPASYQTTVERLYPTMQRLKEQGKIRFIGVSEVANTDVHHEMLQQAVASDLFDVIMIRYNLFHQGAESLIFPKTQAQRIGVMGMCPVEPIRNLDVLKDWLHRHRETGALAAEALTDEDPVKRWLDEGSDVLAEAGMKFVANQQAIDTIITGTANIEHLEANVRAALGPPLTPIEETALRSIYGRLRAERL